MQNDREVAVAGAVRTERVDYQLVADSIPALIAVTGPDGVIQSANRPVFEYFGASLEELQGWTTSELVHPDDLPAVIAARRRSLETGETYLLEHRMRGADGVYRWFQMRGEPLRDSQGKIKQWYVLLADIDDRKRTEALLAGEKHLLEMIALGRPLPDVLNTLCRFVEEIAPECNCGVYLIDWTGPTFQEGFAPGLTDRYTRSLAGLPVVPDGAPCGAAACLKTQVIAEDMENDPRWTAEYRNHVLAFGLRSIWSTPILSQAGNVLGTFAVYQHKPGRPSQTQKDLIAQFTHLASIAIERAQDEAALRQSEAFLAEAQRLSLTGSFIWRVATDEIKWSDQTYRILDVEPDIRPTFELMATRIHPEDAAAFAALVERCRLSGKDFESELRLLMGDGSIKYLQTVAHATRDRNGQLEYIGAVQDVTERRLSDMALGKLRSEFAHVSRVTSLGALTASIAHEVNQPLAGIITNASTCLRMLAADPPNVDGARETARRTIRDGERASDVISRLRALFSKKHAAADSVDLNEAIREVIALILSQLQEKGAVLRIELSEDLPPVTGDRVQLQQVVSNLLLNAAEAMTSIDDRPRELVIETHREGGDVSLSVKDSGVGFDGDDTEKLFDAFYTTKSSGMGIGLSVSRSIVESHHGRLWASPNLGPGATFSLSLPAEASGVVSMTSMFDRHQSIMAGHVSSDASSI